MGYKTIAEMIGNIKDCSFSLANIFSNSSRVTPVIRLNSLSPNFWIFSYAFTFHHPVTFYHICALFASSRMRLL